MSVFSLYLNLGFHHILDFKGYDHVLFLLTLCAVYSLRHWSKLLILITAFTAGHSVTLVLATFQLVEVSASLIEFLIPLTIFFTAIVNFLSPEADYKPLFHRLKYAVALFFGMIHGLGFSYYLRHLLGNSESVLLPLFAFNLGVELGQILVLGLLFLLWLSLSKGISLRQRDWSLVLSGMGMGIALILMLERWPVQA